MTEPYIPNPVQTTIKAHTDAKNSQILADYLPNDEVFAAKNIKTSNTKKLLNGLALEFTRIEQKNVEFVNEWDLSNTVELISRWESSLGIPDDCFQPEEHDLETRRRYCIAKLARMNLTNAQDFIDLASFFGYNIEIFNGAVYGGFPLKLPFLLVESFKTLKFTMIVKFLDVPTPQNTFPLQLPFPLSDDTLFIRCVFDKLKPACTQILYLYSDS